MYDEEGGSQEWSALQDEDSSGLPSDDILKNAGALSFSNIRSDSVLSINLRLTAKPVTCNFSLTDMDIKKNGKTLTFLEMAVRF